MDALAPASQPPATVAALVADLNRLIQQDNLHDDEAFQSVDLKKRTRNLIQLVQKNGERQNIISLNRQLVEQLFPGAIRELQKTIDKTRSRGTLLQDVGALLGMFAFTFAASCFNRRTAFLGSFLLCLGSVSYVFYSLKTATDVLWMLPLMGFATLSCFAGYSIYFPEIFPTRLRGTGRRLLLQHRPLPGGAVSLPARRAERADALPHGRRDRCARFTWWASSPCFGRRKPKASPCRRIELRSRTGRKQAETLA